MNRKNSSGAGLFMMEMILAVFFFILCASTCILVFVKADSMSRLARDTNNGVLAAESVAEVWKKEGTDGLDARFHARTEAGQTEIRWDKGWNAVEKESSAAYLGEMFWEMRDGLETARIVIRRADGRTELFSMTAARFLPGQGSLEDGIR